MKKPPLLLLALCLAASCHSQSGLYITGSTTFSIRPNTLTAIDGLALTPSSIFVISGNNQLIRSNTLSHSSLTPSIKRSYQWATTLPAFSGSIGFYYEDTELNGLTEAELTLNIHNGTQWQAYPSGASRNGVSNVVTTPVSGLLLNELSLAAAAQPLPLEWGRITATRKHTTALIEWETYREEQTEYFIVERSIDGLQWSAVDNAVPAENIPGTHRYQFTDVSVPDGKTFYRIKQVDVDGQINISTIVWIPALDHAMTVSVSPNPASHQLTIRSSNQRLQAVTLFQANGKLLRKEIVPHSTMHTLTLSSLPAGVYVVQVQFIDGNMTTRSFIKH